MPLRISRHAVLIALSILSTVGAQKVVLEPFKPGALPVTTPPRPVPQTMAPIQPGVFGKPVCHPQVRGLLVPVLPISPSATQAASARIQRIVQADQAARSGRSDLSKVAKEDEKRRNQLLPLVPLARTREDFAAIALVFQHGNCLDHFLFANKMAQLAMQSPQRGQPPASKYAEPAWLYAATLDRALQMAGRAQKYGTQYWMADGQCYRLYVTDIKTTDAERKRYLVPPLKDAIANARKFDLPGCH